MQRIEIPETDFIIEYFWDNEFDQIFKYIDTNMTKNYTETFRNTDKFNLENQMSLQDQDKVIRIFLVYIAVQIQNTQTNCKFRTQQIGFTRTKLLFAQLSALYVIYYIVVFIHPQMVMGGWDVYYFQKIQTQRDII
ncbi:Hypothetical_protein [Hexamita inflata]|uniref:Hypothetical_protein n=1 Tax=Hexamita inflata TaxID=28002 RepID=A0AA86U8Q5_9EUKA|nr:Hypothetical protein HINF_LOCUS35385 [Hexamita inflata]